MTSYYIGDSHVHSCLSESFHDMEITTQGNRNIYPDENECRLFKNKIVCFEALLSKFPNAVIGNIEKHDLEALNFHYIILNTKTLPMAKKVLEP